MSRRKDSFILRWWNWATPYVQMAGYIVLIVTVIFTAGGIWSGVSAYEPRLTVLEKNMIRLERIEEKVDAIDHRVDSVDKKQEQMLNVLLRK